MGLLLATCKACNWHGEITRHTPEKCDRYQRMKQMYLGGMASRLIAREFSTSNKTVLDALRATNVKIRRRGGLNNPGGINAPGKQISMAPPKERRAQIDERPHPASISP